MQPDRPVTVSRSSQKGIIALFIWVVGRQTLLKAVLVLLNCKVPLELALAVLKGAPYKLNEKGSAMAVVPSSVWLPVSVVPATSVAPVDWV